MDCLHLVEYTGMGSSFVAGLDKLPTTPFGLRMKLISDPSYVSNFRPYAYFLRPAWPLMGQGDGRLLYLQQYSR
jgi:hypothetical protein